MSLWHIAWSYLWNRKVPTVITILCVALGVGLISAVLTLRRETQRRFEEEGQAFDIVVGAKGSPLQLVLSSVYFLDAPTGNIPYSTCERLRKNEDVAAAYPIGLGDSYKQFRIVGTSRELFDHVWVNAATGQERAPFQLAQGRYFEKPMEAVVGSAVAQQTGLKVNDTFVGTHGYMAGFGESHEATPYTVVGVLKPGNSPFDRAIFCTLDSVWRVHGHEEEAHEAEERHTEASSSTPSAASPESSEAPKKDEPEVTAVLIQLQTPGLRYQFRPYVNDEYNAMAAIPVDVIRKLYDELLGTAKTVMLAVGYLVVVVSAMSIMASLYLSILQRKRDLAIMRALGASPGEIFGAVVLEAFWVTVLGIGSGWLMGNVVSYAMGLYLTQRFGMSITAFGLSMEEVTAYAAVAVTGLLAGIVPAWQAYQTDIAPHLADP